MIWAALLATQLTADDLREFDAAIKPVPVRAAPEIPRSIPQANSRPKCGYDVDETPAAIPPITNPVVVEPETTIAVVQDDPPRRTRFLPAGWVLKKYEAVWCVPCKQWDLDQLPKLVDAGWVTEGENSDLVRVDVDSNPGSLARDGFSAIPAFVLLNGNTIVWRGSGVFPASLLIDRCRTYTAQVIATRQAMPSRPMADSMADSMASITEHIQKHGIRAKDSPNAVSAMFGVTVDVPDDWLEIVRKLRKHGRVTLRDTGCTVIAAPNMTMRVTPEQVKFSPGIGLQYRKSILSWTVTLEAIKHNADLTVLEFEISGSPDFEVRLR